MRVYINNDVRETKICGDLKNIIALAAGIAMRMGYGDNGKAALTTKGLAEINRLGRCMGCVSQIFSGLSGMGALIVTCTREHDSNN